MKKWLAKLTRKNFARHSDPSTTMTYISTRKEELYKEINNAFGINEAVGLKARLSRV